MDASSHISLPDQYHPEKVRNLFDGNVTATKGNERWRRDIDNTRLCSTHRRNLPRILCVILLVQVGQQVSDLRESK